MSMFFILLQYNADVFDNGAIQSKWIHALLVFRHLVELSINVAQKE